MYQKQNADMIKVVEQHSTTLQTLISSLQVNEAIEELVKDTLRETKQDIIQTIKGIGYEKN